MVPLAWAARAAGHEVAVAVPPELRGLAAASGLPYAVVGRDVDAVAAFREIVSAPGGGGGGPRVLRLIGALTEAMAEDLADLVGGWRADLVVHDPTAFAGPIAAAAAGVPAVRHLYGTDLLGAPAARNFLPAVLEPVADRLGLGEVDPFGVATVDPCPGSLQLPTASRRLPMRYVPSSPHGRTVALPPRGSRRRVAVTWGTTLDRLDPSLHLAGEVARAIAGPDTAVVLAVTAEQAPLLGEVPPWTQVVSDGALHQVLPQCDAVVAHGGAASILTAVAAGVPQLLLPRLPDHVRHAARLAEAGAGLVVPAAEAQGQPELVAERLTALLDEPGHAARARELAAESRLQPSPAEVVTELELLVTTEAAADRPVGLKPGSAPR